MEEPEFGITGGSAVQTTPVTKPATEIAKLMSSELLKIYELNEYCNFVESDLKKWCEKVETLTSAKKESFKTITEYKNRNKINVINSESLLQALSELYKYKSELKSIYISTERAAKTKRISYKKIILSYESAWQKALEEYNADPVYVELNKIQQENTLLEKEIEKQKELNASTETQLRMLKGNVIKTFTEAVVEFSKAMLQHKQFLKTKKRNREEDSQICLDVRGNHQFKLFRREERQFDRKCSHDNSDEINYPCSIDVSVFDDITVPSENLESQNLEEDGLLTDASKDEESLDCSNRCPQTVQENTTSVNAPMDISEQSNPKPVDENESQYFRAQFSAASEQPHSDNPQTVERCTGSTHLNVSGEKLKSLTYALSDEEAPKEVQMDYDESISEGSYEKSTENVRVGNYDGHNTSSFSSEDLPPVAENQNESTQPANKLGEKSSNFDTNDFKSFTGFFTMGNDHDTSKPSIFKLF